MILQLEKIREYKKKRDKFLDRIKENFDTFYDDKHDDLNNIINFINYSDSFFAELVHASSVEESAHNSLQVQRDSISRAVRIYNIDAEFNREKANKWLINALVLIVRDSNTFDGVFFTKDKKKLLKTKIVKQ
jgi:hypothetical protein